MVVHSNVAQQVSHWVHDEQACVTVQRIVQTFELSWSDSLTLLKGIPKEGHKYSVTQFASGSDTADSKKTNDAFRLVKSALDTAGPTNESSSVWYALSLEACTESFHTAAEKDTSQFFDGIESFSIPSSLHPSWDKTQDVPGEGFASSIDVSEAMKERLVGKRKAYDAFAKESSAAGGPSIPTQANKTRIVHTKKTVTTARNFFGSKNGSTTTSTTKSTASTKAVKSVATSKGGSNKAKAKTTTTNTATAKSKNVSTFFSQPQKQREGSQSTTSNKSINRVSNEEKENVQNKSSSFSSMKSSSSKVGNADDMEFDQESSDEEIEEVSPSDHYHKKATDDEHQRGVAKKKNRNVGCRDDEEEEEEEEDDNSTSFQKDRAAAAKSNKIDEMISNDVPTKRRRKRKVMVEKTSVDESGYLYTETKAVWEDIPSSEDEKETAGTSNNNNNNNNNNLKSKGAATKPVHANKSKKSSAKPKALKQQSLMGFFKKK